MTNTWISAKNKPPCEESYLVATKKGGINVARWYGKTKQWATQTAAITHWMPFPKPPKSHTLSAGA